ncbi:MAG TPA: DUF1003 domain-containing protein [Shinella sp.]|jgi:uncharacterized membrane protein|uniref:DUF1003 domain-containing protein n=1 Tax=Shinella sp. TaxID=1870904 RepID=UPI0029ACBC5E|nr:DUF1003 domain-containing protein [Shinella sp.]MDX3976940.1 DUF1003 domain-containing protein [Shinella sp.]HEV7247640.1 DUF1003 domain-containing protein [Shinella sp.]
MRPFDDAAQILFGKAASELDETEREVLLHSREGRILSEDRNVAYEAKQSFGERIADDIARIGGSWGFIIGFFLFLIVWTVANTILLTRDAFDPYPFIFLNLVLSMLAAIQAPIIMMSQNRQAARDRFEASKDYEVNLKAEIELIALHHKIDTHFIEEIAELKRQVLRLHNLLEGRN